MDLFLPPSFRYTTLWNFTRDFAVSRSGVNNVGVAQYFLTEGNSVPSNTRLAIDQTQCIAA